MGEYKFNSLTPIYCQLIFEFNISQKQLDECDFLYFLEVYGYKLRQLNVEKNGEEEQTLKGIPED